MSEEPKKVFEPVAPGLRGAVAGAVDFPRHTSVIGQTQKIGCENVFDFAADFY